MDPSEQLAEVDAALRAQAREVRDYLVSLRGGAPFLSGADGQLLGDWLRAGIPVPLILSVLDGVADRRRRKRVRTRLTLSACRRALEKTWRGSQDLRQGATPEEPERDRGAALVALAEEVASAPLAPELLPAQVRLVAELMDLATRSSPPEELARLAVAAVSAFHQDCWERSAARHAELWERAEGELGALRGSVRGAAWRDLVEEVARDLLRQECPAVSARRVWDSLA